VADPDPADRPRRPPLRRVGDQIPAPEPGWLAALAHGEPGLSRVAALGRTAQLAMRAGQASECFAALDEQRAAAGTDPAALVWALTMSSVCRVILGQLTRARADLAEARQNCLYAAPLLAQPYWRFAEIVSNWLGGNWGAAHADASSLRASPQTPIAPALGAVLVALRTEMLRGLGLTGEARVLADRLSASGPAELSAWVRAGLDLDDGHEAEALRRLADVGDGAAGSVYRAALPLVLHRMAATAYRRGDHRASAAAAAALGGLDRAAPLTEILADLARAYATGDAGPARRAQQQAEAEGAGTLAAEALTVRGQVGDDPARTLAAAYSSWERIGAPARAAAVAALMRGAGLAAPPPPARPGAGGGTGHGPATGPAALTARERSVAVLVHEGRTNQQIAHALNISVKTVEAYLTRLYRKTSVSSRVELAVAVTERRLIVTEKDDAAGSA
jgi:DNA-binding NarL/FixJ family response regulator